MRYNTVAVFTILFVFVCAVGTSYGVPATIIDFENVGSEGVLVGGIEVAGMTVNFDTESKVGSNSLPFIAEVGAPRVGFQSQLGEETPLNDDGSFYAEGGRFSLTDGLRQTHNYLMEFSQPVKDLSLDLYDYRGDGPHAQAVLLLDNVQLIVFDEAGAEIGSTMHMLPETRAIDGNVMNLGVSVTGIRSARLAFDGIEGGTAIDNLSFEIVPEPAGLALAGLGLIGLFGLGRRGRRSIA